MIPGDLLFIVQEKSHETFKRQNKHDLIYIANISLKHALLGAKIEIPMLDGRKEAINIPHVIEPNFVKTVHGLGMPRAGYQGSYGDLLINFNILFPKELSEAKKKEVEKVFQDVEFKQSGPGVLQATAEKFRIGLESVKPIFTWLLLMFFFLWVSSGRRY